MNLAEATAVLQKKESDKIAIIGKIDILTHENIIGEWKIKILAITLEDGIANHLTDIDFVPVSDNLVSPKSSQYLNKNVDDELTIRVKNSVVDIRVSSNIQGVNRSVLHQLNSQDSQGAGRVELKLVNEGDEVPVIVCLESKFTSYGELSSSLTNELEKLEKDISDISAKVRESGSTHKAKSTSTSKEKAPKKKKTKSTATAPPSKETEKDTEKTMGPTAISGAWEAAMGGVFAVYELRGYWGFVVASAAIYYYGEMMSV